MGQSISRRGLLRAATSAAGVLALSSPRTAFSFQANERTRLAMIGHMYVAGHFFSSIHAYPGVELVALCHPDRRKLDEAFKTWRGQAEKWMAPKDANDRRAAEVYRRLRDNPPPVFSDFRRMLADAGDGIDAVVVSMFEHYHGPACGAAMRAGKHVFCERPLGLTVRESRALRDLARRQKVATSIRNPGNASNAFRRGVELVREGAIGPVREVHVWFDRAGPDRDAPPTGEQPVPEGLDWDLWLGPIARRPYHEDWMAYATWRETSNGGIGTFGPHAANLAFAALNVHELWDAPAAGAAPAGSPRTIHVKAECPRRNPISFPTWERTRWQVPARGDLPPVTFTWHHGGGLSPGSKEQLLDMMRRRGATGDEATKLLGYAGAMLVGTEGVLVSDDHNVKVTLLPAEKFKGVGQGTPKKLPPSRGHYQDWFNACRGGEPAFANFDYANPLSEFLMLGNVATRFEGEIVYDPLAARVVNNDDADRALGYEYREGWVL